MTYIGTKDFVLEVRRGNVAGFEYYNKFGYNSVINTGTVPEDIWNGGGVYTGHNATAAETVEVFSASANDTSAGTGARTILLLGLDANYDRQEETVTLNGTTPVTTVNQYLRLDRAIVQTAGSGGFNDGTITIRQQTTTANIFAAVPAGRNQTNICCLTVPAGVTDYIYELTMECNRGGDTEAEFDVFVREENGVYVGKNPGVVSKAGGQYIRNGRPWLTVPEKSDIVVRVLQVGGNGTQVSASLDLMFVVN